MLHSDTLPNQDVVAGTRRKSEMIDRKFKSPEVYRAQAKSGSKRDYANEEKCL